MVFILMKVMTIIQIIMSNNKEHVPPCAFQITDSETCWLLIRLVCKIYFCLTYEGQNDQCVSHAHVVCPSYGNEASFLTGGNAGQGLFSETQPQKAQKERRGEDLKKLQSCVFRHRQLSSSTDSNSSFCNSVAPLDIFESIMPVIIYAQTHCLFVFAQAITSLWYFLCSAKTQCCSPPWTQSLTFRSSFSEILRSEPASTLVPCFPLVVTISAFIPTELHLPNFSHFPPLKYRKEPQLLQLTTIPAS